MLDSRLIIIQEYLEQVKRGLFVVLIFSISEIGYQAKYPRTERF